MSRICATSLLGLVALLLLLPISGSAVTIVSQGGPSTNHAGVEISVDEALDVSWTSANSYSNVAISVLLGEGADIPEPGLAYLTTSIGPGTTTADEVASTAFTYPNPHGGVFTVFDGLTLGPGTYYLTLYSPSLPGSAWLVTGDPVQVTDSASTVGQSSYSVHPAFDVIGPYAYAPALPFVLAQISEQWDFDVTGDPMGTAAPEPAGCSLLILGCLVIILSSRAGLSKRKTA